MSIKVWDGAAWQDVSGGAGSLPTGGTTGQALLKQSDADYDTVWATPTPAAEILAFFQGTSASANTANNTATFAYVDTTGFPLTFTVPSSGVVYVTASNFIWRNSSAGRGINIRLVDTSTATPISGVTMVRENNTTNARNEANLIRRVSGLTAGASLTWGWQFNNAGGGTTEWWYGPEGRWPCWYVWRME